MSDPNETSGYQYDVVMAEAYRISARTVCLTGSAALGAVGYYDCLTLSQDFDAGNIGRAALEIAISVAILKFDKHFLRREG